MTNWPALFETIQGALWLNPMDYREARRLDMEPLEFVTGGCRTLPADRSLHVNIHAEYGDQFSILVHMEIPVGCYRVTPDKPYWVLVPDVQAALVLEMRKVPDRPLPEMAP